MKIINDKIKEKEKRVPCPEPSSMSSARLQQGGFEIFIGRIHGVVSVLTASLSLHWEMFQAFWYKHLNFNLLEGWTWTCTHLLKQTPSPSLSSFAHLFQKGNDYCTQFLVFFSGSKSKLLLFLNSFLGKFQNFQYTWFLVH